jgi:hypothetical protein
MVKKSAINTTKHLAALFVFFFLIRLPEVAACVGCRQPGAGGPDEPQTVTAGIALSWGVVGMLAIVGLIVAGLTYYIAHTCRNLDRSNKVP